MWCSFINTRSIDLVLVLKTNLKFNSLLGMRSHSKTVKMANHLLSNYFSIKFYISSKKQLSRFYIGLEIILKKKRSDARISRSVCSHNSEQLNRKSAVTFQLLMNNCQDNFFILKTWFVSIVKNQWLICLCSYWLLEISKYLKSKLGLYLDIFSERNQLILNFQSTRDRYHSSHCSVAQLK